MPSNNILGKKKGQSSFQQMLILVAKMITVVCEKIGSFLPIGKINTALCTLCELKSMM